MRHKEVPTKKTLAWQCRRGMLELDVLFKTYLENCYDDLSDDNKHQFSELLTCVDPELFAWFMGQESAPEEYQILIHDIKRANG